MDDRQPPAPPPDHAARNRWMAINLVRAGGVAMVVIGLLMINGRFGGSALAGYALLVLGFGVAFAGPRRLARKWRSPSE